MACVTQGHVRMLSDQELSTSQAWFHFDTPLWVNSQYDHCFIRCISIRIKRYLPADALNGSRT